MKIFSKVCLHLIQVSFLWQLAIKLKSEVVDFVLQSMAYSMVLYCIAFY